MTSLPARSGLEWIKQGFALFRQQPGRLAFLFLGAMVFSVLLKAIPVLGEPLALVLLPVFGAAFMQAAASIDRGQPVTPDLILTGFRKPAFPALFRLGIVYFLVFALAAAVMMAMVDDSLVDMMKSGKIDQRQMEAQAAQLWKPMLAALAIYIPAAMAFAFAVPLILWRGMGVAKAIFFSFFAVWRNLRAFLMFGMGWFVLVTLITQFLAVIAGPQLLGVVLMPVIVLFGILTQCSFYASYRQVFGAPGADVAESAIN